MYCIFNFWDVTIGTKITPSKTTIHNHVTFGRLVESDTCNNWKGSNVPQGFMVLKWNWKDWRSELTQWQPSTRSNVDPTSRIFVDPSLPFISDGRIQPTTNHYEVELTLVKFWISFETGLAGLITVLNNPIRNAKPHATVLNNTKLYHQMTMHIVLSNQPVGKSLQIHLRE